MTGRGPHRKVGTMPTNGRRFLLHALALLALLGTVASTLWVVFWASFTLGPGGVSPATLRLEVTAAIVGCLLLLAAVVPVRVARLSPWIVVVDVVLAGLLGLFAALLAGSEAHGTGGGDHSFTWLLGMFLITPTTWPVFALLLATPFLRGRSSPAPRSPRVR